MKDMTFGTFQQLQKNLNTREIVLFGAGTFAHKTGRKLNNNFNSIVDNNPNLWDTFEEGKKVLNPKKIDQHSDKYFVVICTTSFIEVSKQLEKYGYVPGKDFMVSPILNDLHIISELENHCVKLLFTSGLPEVDDPESGGGVYELLIDGHNWTYKKIYSGICYGLIKYKESYITVDDKNGLVQLDESYKVIKTKKLENATRGHGIAYSDITNEFYIVSSYRDSIIILNELFEQIDEIFVSNKYKVSGNPEHHCNDICIVENSLYVTMFSYTGNWKRDIFDGVALEIDLTSRKKIGLVIDDLWMPHNISFLDGSLTVLDSLRGELKTNNARPIGRFPAFTRGLDFDGIYYYVGQSRNRNYSKNLGLSLNISIDTAIIIFDPLTKASRTIHFPQKLSEIHSILVIE
jgi:hypothetical protein